MGTAVLFTFGLGVGSAAAGTILKTASNSSNLGRSINTLQTFAKAHPYASSALKWGTLGGTLTVGNQYLNATIQGQDYSFTQGLKDFGTGFGVGAVLGRAGRGLFNAANSRPLLQTALRATSGGVITTSSAYISSALQHRPT